MFARQAGLGFAAPAVEGTLAKVERVLPPALRERVRAVQDTLILDVAQLDTTVESAILGTLSMAAQQHRRVTLGYRGRDHAETRRELDPYSVICHGGRWYTVGYCHLRQDVRVFRLDRVRHVEPAGATFDPPVGFDGLDYVVRSFAAIPDTWDVEVLLHTTLEEARRNVPASLALLEQRPVGVWLRASINDLDRMARTLVGLACPLAIHRPPELRAALRRLAGEIAQLADSGDPGAVEPTTLAGS